MTEAIFKSIYFWFKGWHYDIGKTVCVPLEHTLPSSISPYCARLIDGFFTTLELVTLALIFAFLLARMMAQLLAIGPTLSHKPIKIYVYIFQGTPILIQLWMVYYGLAQFKWIQQSAGWVLLGSGWWVGLIVLTLNSAAYQTNILIGSIRNLPQGQLEGAHSIGLNPRKTYQKILFPQAMRTSWPALANEGILLLKASALVSTITVLDLMGHARTVFSRSYDLWVYGGVALLYILLTALMTLVAFLIRRYWFQSLPSDSWFREKSR
ncbi:MAG: ABC transporter permease [Gammaproteobacteria bacterium]|nr:ABC transporter permease [Gammaproteobacteria bacterium]